MGRTEYNGIFGAIAVEMRMSRKTIPMNVVFLPVFALVSVLPFFILGLLGSGLVPGIEAFQGPPAAAFLAAAGLSLIVGLLAGWVLARRTSSGLKSVGRVLDGFGEDAGEGRGRTASRIREISALSDRYCLESMPKLAAAVAETRNAVSLNEKTSWTVEPAKPWWVPPEMV